MATPHISARKGEFAPTVLMPGDPLRARYMADNFLEDARKVTSVRNMEGYTGTYKGVDVSVMASGMGMPSIGIYSHELFDAYDVQSIIRVGSAGALSPKCHLGDIVLAQGACTDSDWQSQYGIQGHFAPIADWNLLCRCSEAAKQLDCKVTIGNILATDFFYRPKADAANRVWAGMGVLCSDMESAALYMEAALLGRHALSILTISDELYGRHLALSPQERQQELKDMIELAFETAVLIERDDG